LEQRRCLLLDVVVAAHAGIETARMTRISTTRRTACAALALLPLLGHAQTPHTHDHGFAGAEHWSKVFDDPARDAWQKPHEVIQALKLPPTAVVADIGAGTGYFAVRLANMVPGGRVLAVDLEPDMVRYLDERARKSGLKNLVAVQGAADDPKLPERVDLALLVDVYHHIGARESYFAALKKRLKPDGRVAVIDFTKDSPIGPPPEARLAASQVIAEMTRAGYRLATEHRFLPNQYFLVFAPKSAPQ
jgi:ubiquinone/menaquinone biosynthesis C-methylase UbiE